MVCGVRGRYHRESDMTGDRAADFEIRVNENQVNDVASLNAIDFLL